MYSSHYHPPPWLREIWLWVNGDSLLERGKKKISHTHGFFGQNSCLKHETCPSSLAGQKYRFMAKSPPSVLHVLLCSGSSTHDEFVSLRSAKVQGAPKVIPSHY